MGSVRFLLFVGCIVLRVGGTPTARPKIGKALPVRLCSCSAERAQHQRWSWGPSVALPGGGGRVSQPAPIRLLADPSRCLFTQAAGGVRPTYLELRDCSGGPGQLGAPPQLQLSFRSTHKAGMGRNSDVLSTGDGSNSSKCMDADGMTANLQLYTCLANDDDQQYAAVDGYA